MRSRSGTSDGGHYGPDLAYVHHAGFTEFARSAAPGIVAILRRHGIEKGLIVDAGCGSGVLSRALSDAGYGVFGFDLSPDMIAIARKNAPTVRFEVASFTEADLPPCDAVCAIGEILNYIPDGESVFPRVAAALRPGGIFLFDVGRSGAYPREGSSHTAGDGWEVYVEKRTDAANRHLTRRVITYREGRRTEEVHETRLYDRDEVIARLRKAGFSVQVRRSYGTRRVPPTHDVFLAKKLRR